MRRLILICLLGLSSIGCKTDPRATREIAVLRSEILNLEDQYYSLKSQYRQVADDLRACKGEPATDGPYYDDSLPFNNRNSLPFCDDPVSTYDSPMLPDTGSRTIQYREPNVATQSEELPPPNKAGQSDSTKPNKDNNTQGSTWTPNDEIRLEGSDMSGQFRQASTFTEEVASVAISESATRGEDLDGIAGDEGLVVLIQPLSRSGRAIRTTGDLTVTIVDPQETGDRQEIGTWQFSAEEVPNFFVKKDLVQQGILLHLPWDFRTPRNQTLVVSVQFTDTKRQVHRSAYELSIIPPRQDYSPDDSLVVQWLEEDVRWVDLGNPEPAMSSVLARQGIEETADRGNGPRPVPSTRGTTPRWRPVR
ncbi:MAG: hypothetical protein MK106_12055 [Mariniblastus sp.]|nr:hypothetical protein [Mariniblastus sp.]